MAGRVFSLALFLAPALHALGQLTRRGGVPFQSHAIAGSLSANQAGSGIGIQDSNEVMVKFILYIISSTR